MKKKSLIALILSACVMAFCACDMNISPDLLKEAQAKENVKVEENITDNTSGEKQNETSNNDNSATDDSKPEDAYNTSEDKPSELSTSQKIWRVYKKVNPESSIDGYLYLEIDKSKGGVSIQHQYYSENAYSYVSWPLSDQMITITEYDMSGASNVWQEYMEYSESVIKLYYVDSDGAVDRESYEEFKFESEDYLN